MCIRDSFNIAHLLVTHWRHRHSEGLGDNLVAAADAEYRQGGFFEETKHWLQVCRVIIGPGGGLPRNQNADRVVLHHPRSIRLRIMDDINIHIGQLRYNPCLLYTSRCV